MNTWRSFIAARCNDNECRSRWWSPLYKKWNLPPPPGLHHIVQCMKHQFYGNAHHECKEYIINFHLLNVETNLKISSPVKQKDILHFAILQFHAPSLRQGTEHTKQEAKTIQISVSRFYIPVDFLVITLADEERVQSGITPSLSRCLRRSIKTSLYAYFIWFSRSFLRIAFENPCYLYLSHTDTHDLLPMHRIYTFEKQGALKQKCLGLYVTRQLIWRQTPKLLLQFTEMKI